MPRFVNYRLVGSNTTTLVSGDVPFSITGLAAGQYEVNDGLAWRGPFTVTAPGGGTPTPTPAPAFTTQPSVSPTSGTAGTTTFTATPGAVSNGTISSRAWLLNGNSVSTGTTFSPNSGQTGTVTYQETATGAGGTAQSAIQTVTVAASGGGTPEPIPTLFYEDTFTSSTGAAKNASTHTSDSGATYTMQTGSLSVGATGSTYSLTSPFLYLISTVMPDTGNFDIEEVIDSRTAAASGVTFVFNSDGASPPTALALAVSVTGAITLQRLNGANAFTALATYEQGTIADGDTYLIRGRLSEVDGMEVKTIEVLLNGAQIIAPVTVTGGPSGNRMQLRNGGNSPNSATTGIGWDRIRAYTI